MKNIPRSFTLLIFFIKTCRQHLLDMLPLSGSQIDFKFRINKVRSYIWLCLKKKKKKKKKKWINTATTKTWVTKQCTMFTFHLLYLTFTTLWANSADNKLMIIFFIFSQKTGFEISCKLSPLETICMKFQIMFTNKNRSILNCCLPRVLSLLMLQVF